MKEIAQSFRNRNDSVQLTRYDDDNDDNPEDLGKLNTRNGKANIEMDTIYDDNGWERIDLRVTINGTNVTRICPEHTEGPMSQRVIRKLCVIDGYRAVRKRVHVSMYLDINTALKPQCPEFGNRSNKTVKSKSKKSKSILPAPSKHPPILFSQRIYIYFFYDHLMQKHKVIKKLTGVEINLKDLFRQTLNLDIGSYQDSSNSDVDEFATGQEGESSDTDESGDSQNSGVDEIETHQEDGGNSGI